MDDLDNALVSLLRHDCRRSVSDLALELGVSRATVRTRIEKLEKAGTILGYTVVLRSDTIYSPVRGIMMIELEGRSADRVVNMLGGFLGVSAVHNTNGKWDLVVELCAENLIDLDAVLHRIRLIPGIVSSETNLLLSTPRSISAITA